VVNHKRLRRLWREEGLRRPPPRRNKRRRPGNSAGVLLRAGHPNHVWALDFQFDETADQRRLKILNVVDEHT
jgi:putative transposase